MKSPLLCKHSGELFFCFWRRVAVRSIFNQHRQLTMRKILLLSCFMAILASGLPAGSDPVRQSADEKPLRPKPVTPPAPEVIISSLQRGIEFLLKDQNKDGSWGTPNRTKNLNIYAPVPDAHLAFRAAVTALSVSALIELGGPPEVHKAIERGEEWLFANLPDLRRSSADALYNVWSHIYGIQALVHMYDRLPNDAVRRKKIETYIQGQYEFLKKYESVDGGWGYYDFRIGALRPATDSTSFMNAAGLIAAYEAKQIGALPPERLMKRAIDATVRQRKPDFSYIYGEYLKWKPMMPINRPGGSLGRSQACNLALRLWGDQRITDDVLKEWLDRLFSRNLWLDIGRKRPIPHESHFQVAGYFFFFGHYYAARCIEQLKPEDRPFYQDHLATLMLRLQEKDGSWWDFPLYNYHQQYGTAFALMTLKRCRHESAETPRSGSVQQR
jgi:hypothetical protein